MSDTDIIINNVAGHFKVKIAEVSLNTNLIDDLGADSLDSVELVLDMEREFDIEIPDGEAAEYRIVGDIADAIDKGVYAE